MNLVITMSRRYGTGASTIAKELSERLGLPVYDKVDVEQEVRKNAFETEAGLAACRSVFASVHAPWMLRIDADAGKEEVAARVRKALSVRFPDVIGA